MISLFPDWLVFAVAIALITASVKTSSERPGSRDRSWALQLVAMDLDLLYWDADLKAARRFPKKGHFCQFALNLSEEQAIARQEFGFQTWP